MVQPLWISLKKEAENTHEYEKIDPGIPLRIFRFLDKKNSAAQINVQSWHMRDSFLYVSLCWLTASASSGEQVLEYGFGIWPLSIFLIFLIIAS